MKETFDYKYYELFNPVLKSLHELGGSGSVDEIEEHVATILSLTDDQITDTQKGPVSKFSYRLAWARNYLKQYGLLENSSRGVWALTKSGLATKEVDNLEVRRKVGQMNRTERGKRGKSEPIESPDELPETEEIQQLTWQEEVIAEVQSIKPDSFERLCQRLLRELGFQNVEVTGKSNDGGIDGKGILKIGGVLSFYVVFQAKRYKGSVSPSIVRDFRGAMVGRADKGLIITTGTFTREAKKEAQRDGAPPIDLMEGKDLAENLKNLKLGIETEIIEKVIIKREWFKDL